LSAKKIFIGKVTKSLKSFKAVAKTRRKAFPQ